jgi:hypothetical protein
MRCLNCGTDIQAESKFCTQCGAPVREGCPRCGRAGARFCVQCGTTPNPTHYLIASSLPNPYNSLQPVGAACAPWCLGPRW